MFLPKHTKGCKTAKHRWWTLASPQAFRHTLHVLCMTDVLFFLFFADILCSRDAFSERLNLQMRVQKLRILLFIAGANQGCTGQSVRAYFCARVQRDEGIHCPGWRRARSDEKASSEPSGHSEGRGSRGRGRRPSSGSRVGKEAKETQILYAFLFRQRMIIQLFRLLVRTRLHQLIRCTSYLDGDNNLINHTCTNSQYIQSTIWYICLHRYTRKGGLLMSVPVYSRCDGNKILFVSSCWLWKISQPVDNEFGKNMREK